VSRLFFKSGTKNPDKYWIKFIKQRLSTKVRKNFLGFISGQTGAGKSWASISIGESVDKNFNINQVVFSGIELMELINSGKLKRGSVIIFEEVGVELSNKNWFSLMNKTINYLVQTFRSMGFCLIMNSPDMDFVDSATRKLFHAEFQMVGIDYETEEGRLKPQYIQYNGRLQKFYYKYLRVNNKGSIQPVKKWLVPKPSQPLIDAYELKKKEYQDKLYARLHSELIKDEEKNDPNRKNKLTDLQQEVVDMMKSGMTIKEVAAKKDRTERTIYLVIEGTKKKGYRFEKVLDGMKVKHYNVIEPETKEYSNIPTKT